MLVLLQNVSGCLCPPDRAERCPFFCHELQSSGTLPAELQARTSSVEGGMLSVFFWCSLGFLDTCLVICEYVLGSFSSFLGYLSIWGVPPRKRYQKGLQKLIDSGPNLEPFWRQSKPRDPSKKTSIFKVPPKRLQSGIWRPKGSNRTSKGIIVEVFLGTFSWPHRKCEK